MTSSLQALPRLPRTSAVTSSPLPSSKTMKLSRSCGSSDIEDSITANISFTEEEALQIRKNLLEWYDAHQRQLPWRHKRRQVACGLEGDSAEELLQLQQQRAYRTWVSEVMLQQTRVATVVQYFNRWMERWPTVNDLAAASEEEVNALWAGLGYYRRARFLLEGAKQIVKLRGGLLPSSVDELRKIPGIGSYTAGAIASIAFNQPVPVVDGNVIRVLCRLQAISASPKASTTLKTLWALSGQLVDAQRPGDLNQALMELGATKCLRSAPNCSSCPLGKTCKAFALTKSATGSMNSVLVTDFPVKVKKNPLRQEYVAVCVLERSGSSGTDLQRNKRSQPDGSFLLVKRPKKGLLAGLWEFPSVSLPGPDVSSKICKASIDRYLKCLTGLDIAQGCHVIKARENVGTYVHVFSHIRLHMSIEWIHLNGHDGSSAVQDSAEDIIETKWVSSNEIEEVGLTSGVRKVYKMFLEVRNAKANFIQKGSKRKRKID